MNRANNDSNALHDKNMAFVNTKMGYVIEHVALGTVLGYDLLHFLPKFIRIAAFDKSVFGVIVCLIISCAVGIALTWHERIGRNVCINVIAGLGVYVVWNFMDYLSTDRFRLMLIIAVCVAIAGIGLALFGQKKRESEEESSPAEAKGRTHKLEVAWVGIAMAVITACIFLPISVKCMDDAEIKSTYYEKVGYDGAVEDTYEPTYVYGDEYSEDNNMEIIKNVDDSIWSTLSDSDKEETLKTVAYAYANFWGMGSKMEIIFSDDSFDDEYGKYEYNSDQSKVYISMECLSDSEIALQAIFHQVYHVYQCELCEIYVKLTDTQRALWKYDDCSSYIRYLDGDPLLGYENEEDAEVFESAARIEGQFEARSYRRHVYNYLNPDQED